MQLPACGERFDNKYTLQQVIADGGNGRVYRALDSAAAREVAIKVLYPDKGTAYSPQTESRFTREVRIIANLRDDHTVTMFDFGRTEDGLLFMVFELVPGQDLSQLISSAGRLDGATAIHILTQVLLSLREAHAAGLLHRDIKPENIRVFDFMGEPLRVKVLDFGIARAATPGNASITRTGELVGTPRYMSPEQLTQRPLTPASDIYSLGVVGFEMLMGRDALAPNQWGAQINRLVTGHVFSIPEFERVGRGLAEVISKMAARRPEDRYQSADAVLAALARLDQGAIPTHVAPAPRDDTLGALTTRQHITRTVREIPTAVWFVVISILAVAIAWPVARIFGRDDEPAPLRTRVISQSVPSFVRTAPAASATQGQAVISADAGQGPRDEGLATDAADTFDAGTVDDGCGKPPPHTGDGILSRVVRGVERDWRVYVPRGYDPSVRHPVVVLFHQDIQTSGEILAETKLDELADEQNFVIVASGGGRLAWPDRSSVVAALRDLDRTETELCIDDDHVFVLGHGSGGRAAVRAPCLRPIAAVATTSWRQQPIHPLCEGFRNVPYINLSPLHDGYVPVDGGNGCSLIGKLSLEEHDALHRERNECDESPPRRTVHKDGTCFEFRCKAPYVTCHIDGGRGWPGSGKRPFDLADCDGQPSHFPFQTTIWDFFERTLK